MKGIVIVAVKPNPSAGLVAAVHDSNLVLRIGVEADIAHLERRIEEGFGMVVPGHSARSGRFLIGFIRHKVLLKSSAGRFQRARVALEAGATSVSEPADQAYGARSGGVKDVYGNVWYLATPIAQQST